MINEQYWHAVVERDRAFDGVFVYAVKSTGIYCRPTCPSRRPRREMVNFFERPALAESAGYRPCLRCHPDRETREEPHLPLIEQMCQLLTEERDRPPTLQELGERFHMSPYHLQRTFKRLIGVTPRQFAWARRSERFREHLREGNRVTDAVYSAGFGSSSSAYEQAADHLGMTPATYKRGGVATTIRFTVSSCSLGFLLVAATAQGLCAVRLGDSAGELETQLHAEFPSARIERDDPALERELLVLLEHLEGNRPHLDLPTDVQATAFQRQVWEALRAIPYGSTRSYGQVAAAIGRPGAARAVAQACAANPVALAVPCHRVIRENRELGGYRWGIERKRALLAREAAAEPTSRDESERKTGS